ncbi:MAG: M14 family zinc carboxypeptidase [Smithellaceae bacterium]
MKHIPKRILVPGAGFRWVGAARLAVVFFGFLACFAPHAALASDRTAGLLSTPLEASAFQRLTMEAERSEYLRALTQYPAKRLTVQLQAIGETVQKRPMEALLVQARDPQEDASGVPLRVLLLGGQHGNEVSGSEALLIFARQWLTRVETDGSPFAMTLLIVPAVNPDGIANKRRVNAQGVNLSTDYGLLQAPESTAINRLLVEFQPHVVLDIHESALLKKKTLGAEGWLTDFEAQFEYANNPNVNGDLKTFTSDVLLPAILKNVESKGLAAHRYFGEITRTDQVVQHGGLSAHNFRNKAGIHGAVSFLLENRLDPSIGVYPTPRNIRERVEKQLLAIDAFLSVCQAHAGQIVALTESARNSGAQESRKVFLQPEYGILPAQPTIDIALRRLESNEKVMHRFRYRGEIIAGPVSMAPKRYVFMSHIGFFRQWLVKQGIPFAEGASPEQAPYVTAEVNSVNGRFLPLFLEPASASSILGRLPFDTEDLKVLPDHR